MGKALKRGGGKVGKAKRPRIVLDRTEWRRFRASAKRATALPKHGVYFMFMPDPDGGAEGMPFCAEDGPDTICMVVPQLEPGGGISY